MTAQTTQSSFERFAHKRPLLWLKRRFAGFRQQDANDMRRTNEPAEFNGSAYIRISHDTLQMHGKSTTNPICDEMMPIPNIPVDKPPKLPSDAPQSPSS